MKLAKMIYLDGFDPIRRGSDALFFRRTDRNAVVVVFSDGANDPHSF